MSYQWVAARWAFASSGSPLLVLLSLLIFSCLLYGEINSLFLTVCGGAGHFSHKTLRHHKIGAEVSQSVLMPKCLVAEVSGNRLWNSTGRQTWTDLKLEGSPTDPTSAPHFITFALQSLCCEERCGPSPVQTQWRLTHSTVINVVSALTPLPVNKVAHFGREPNHTLSKLFLLRRYTRPPRCGGCFSLVVVITRTARIMGVGAQSTLGGGARHFCPKNNVWKINEMSEFYMILARKMSKIPEFFKYFSEKLTKFQNNKIPKFYMIFLPEKCPILHNNCPKNTFSRILGGGARAPHLPLSPTFMARMVLFSAMSVCVSVCLLMSVYNTITLEPLEIPIITNFSRHHSIVEGGEGGTSSKMTI